MPSASTVDYRTSLLALRAAVHRVREAPSPASLADLSRAALTVPGDPREDEQHLGILRALEDAEQSPVFPLIDHMVSAVAELSRLQPRWFRPHETEAMADVIRLLNLCHEHQPDMESHRKSPWNRAAEAGSRLIAILMRRTDARPATASLLRSADEFADRMRTAVARRAIALAGQFAESVAYRNGLFRIGQRILQGDGDDVTWSRAVGTRRYMFHLIEAGWREGFPHGCVDVRLTNSTNVRTFTLTSRTRRQVLDRFINSL